MGTGVDQLYHCSVQPGYLKILQMGDTYPRHKSRKTEYEVKPQYEELSKQLNMQHAINQCYECMKAIKESDSPSQLGGRHSNPIVTTPMIALDFSGTTQRSASHNMAPNQVIKSICQGSICMRVCQSISMHNAYKAYYMKARLESMGIDGRNVRMNSVGRGFEYEDKKYQVLNNSKCRSTLLYITLKSNSCCPRKYSVDVNSRYLTADTISSFFRLEPAATTSRYTLKGKHQNDIVPTNSNDVAALHQLTTDISQQPSATDIVKLLKTTTHQLIQTTS
ncbi:hypothetical protein F511_28337 [Dorcoceras hygrometricum]|uniref:Uncharacterized protein n=1 Tax=Dorcoceras hygrometricum TaxID=472368 RepID=A0A2Z7CXR5_9LAMI|nr:hypothetical protein F511_28337 [Dorcoceras hygrometricum]